MSDFCTCEDWKSVKDSNHTVFKWHSTYGWIISWIELTDEKSHTQIHRYGLNISYCPMCGKKLHQRTESQGE